MAKEKEPATITKKTVTNWYLGGNEVFSQNGDGTWAMSSGFYYNLTQEKLRQLHAVIGEMLTDMAGHTGTGKRQVVSEAVEEQVEVL